MQKFCIFGNSNSHLSMIFESLYSLYREEFKIDLVENIFIEDKLEYIIPNIQFRKLLFREFDKIELESIKAILGVYNPKMKVKIVGFFKKNCEIEFKHYINLIHVNHCISQSTTIDRGNNIGPGSILAPYSSLGNFVTINRQVTIGHHTHIDDYSTVNPGCNIAGSCIIGKSVLIGVGANIVDGIHIGDNSVIAAGSVVTRNVEPNTLVMGVPAKVKDKI